MSVKYILSLIERLINHNVIFYINDTLTNEQKHIKTAANETGNHDIKY